MARNILGGELQPCSMDPVTGFFRDGCCNTGPADVGLHVVCVEVSAGFRPCSRDHRPNPTQNAYWGVRATALAPGTRTAPGWAPGPARAYQIALTMLGSSPS